MELCYVSGCRAPAGWRCLNCGECVDEEHLMPENHDCAPLRSPGDDDEPVDECDLGNGG